jgi:hypothetical protein
MFSAVFSDDETKTRSQIFVHVYYTLTFDDVVQPTCVVKPLTCVIEAKLWDSKTSLESYSDMKTFMPRFVEALRNFRADQVLMAQMILHAKLLEVLEKDQKTAEGG